MTSAELLPAAVLNRKAVVYVRQSTQTQVQTLDIGLPAILTSTVFRHFKPCMIAALPMQHEAQSIGRDRDDDLVEDGP